MLYKPKYQYKNIEKDNFVNKYEQSDVVEDLKNFWKKIEKSKLYIFKLNKNDIIIINES